MVVVGAYRIGDNEWRYKLALDNNKYNLFASSPERLASKVEDRSSLGNLWSSKPRNIYIASERLFQSRGLSNQELLDFKSSLGSNK